MATLDITVAPPGKPSVRVTKVGGRYSVKLDGVSDIINRLPTNAEHALGVPRRSHSAGTTTINDSRTWPLEVVHVNVQTALKNAIEIFKRLAGQTYRRQNGTHMGFVKYSLLCWRMRTLQRLVLIALANAGELPAKGILYG